MSGEPCPFCEIVAGRAPATIIYEWDRAMVIEPLNPVTPGHVIVIPKAHVPNFATNPSISAQTMDYAACYVADWRVGDCNLITSRGAAATQSVFHLHVHVVPRVEGDGLHLPWTGQRKRRPGLAEGDRARIAAEVSAMCHRGDWWHADTGKTLEDACIELVGLGVPVDRATDIIATVKGAIADEYGD